MVQTEEVYEKLRHLLLEEMEERREITDEEICREIDDLILKEKQTLPLSVRVELRKQLFNSVRRLDILQELIDDDSVTEIMVNGTEGIYLERAGKLMRWEKSFSSVSKLEDIAQQIVAFSNRIVNESTPIVDARLENGSRVNIVMPPVALNGPVITIRRFPDHPLGMEELIRCNSITQQAADFLKQLVTAGYNIFICGGTGSGKTTFLNALSSWIPADERIITIEDNAELQIQGVANLVRMEARNANAEGRLAVTIRDLIKTSLRMRPDRIIIGEVRGGEVVDLLSAMNTGHDGSLSTGHGNSPRDMLSRLETMALFAGIELPLAAIRRQIASALDILIFLGRFRDRSRHVIQIVEVLDYDTSANEIQTRLLYDFEETGETEDGKVLGRLVCRNPLKNIQKLRRAGLEL